MVQERERQAREQEEREVEIARGNPLLNPQDFNIKRRWDDDVVFKNQARGTEKKDGKEFVNVCASCCSLVNFATDADLGLASFGLPQKVYGKFHLSHRVTLLRF